MPPTRADLAIYALEYARRIDGLTASLYPCELCRQARIARKLPPAQHFAEHIAHNWYTSALADYVLYVERSPEVSPIARQWLYFQRAKLSPLVTEVSYRQAQESIAPYLPRVRNLGELERRIEALTPTCRTEYRLAIQRILFTMFGYALSEY